MRTVTIKLLKDGSGRVRIHWFQRRADGPIKTPGNSIPTALGPLNFGGAVGRIACMPDRKTVFPAESGGDIEPCCHSDDARAVTCPECQATEEYKAAVAELAELLETNPRAR